LSGIGPGYFTEAGNFYQICIYPVRAGILTSVSGGVAFQDAWERRRVSPLFGIADVPFVCLDNLVAMKRASGRDEDLLDVKRLERAFPQRP
jgi:hypothetical protein